MHPTICHYISCLYEFISQMWEVQVYSMRFKCFTSQSDMSADITLCKQKIVFLKDSEKRKEKYVYDLLTSHIIHLRQPCYLFPLAFKVKHQYHIVNLPCSFYHARTNHYISFFTRSRKKWVLLHLLHWWW